MNGSYFVLTLIFAILVLTFIALILPITAEISYKNKKVDISLKILFFNIRFNKKNSSGTGGNKVKKDKTKKDSDLSKTLKYTGKIKNLIKDSKKILLKAIRSIKVKNIDVLIYAPGKNSFETATNYGRICSVIYPTFSALININEPEKYSIIVRPNFFEAEDLVYLDLSLQFRAIHCVIIFFDIILKIAKISRI